VRVGVDTGGTFTDAVTERGEVAKVASSRAAPDEAVARALRAVGAARPEVLAHGTTVATNALLERRGARVALLATAGFGDVVEIARQDRPSLYDAFADRPDPLVARDLRLDVPERLAADGRVVVPLDEAALPEVPAQADVLAVCLLHADLAPGHEQRVAARYRGEGRDVTCSHEVSPEYREYERMITTVVNAYLRPACRSYLARLGDLAAEALVMTSAGGLVPVGDAADVPAALLLSGPAGGVRAAAAVAAACGFPDAVAFDMGGTSTDVCLVQGGVPDPAPSLVVGGYPIRLPALGVHTIGAGGGSIAAIDEGGALVVGPRSAGAEPGPACYGRGGAEPTVTDADLVLGRIPAGAPFPDLGALDAGAARAALAAAGVDAQGVVAVVDESMRQAVRAVTVERGVDARSLALVAFGGAGPLHACAVAEGLGMPAVIVPPRAGVLSAVGLLCAPRRRELVRSWGGGSPAGLARALDDLAAEAAALVGPGAAVETALDCRYAGQSHEITVASLDGFAREHERRNGYARPGAPVEVVALRARATLDAPVDPHDLPAQPRAPLAGPAVAAEPDCTVWVPGGWRAEPGALGAWILTREGA
jgi:N-methylhydantoinase A/oxoprolinase/acetone carboxylase beta subunit